MTFASSEKTRYICETPRPTPPPMSQVLQQGETIVPGINIAADTKPTETSKWKLAGDHMSLVFFL